MQYVLQRRELGTSFQSITLFEARKCRFIFFTTYFPPSIAVSVYVLLYRYGMLWARGSAEARWSNGRRRGARASPGLVRQHKALHVAAALQAPSTGAPRLPMQLGGPQQAWQKRGLARAGGGRRLGIQTLYGLKSCFRHPVFSGLILKSAAWNPCTVAVPRNPHGEMNGCACVQTVTLGECRFELLKALEAVFSIQRPPCFNAEQDESATASAEKIRVPARGPR